MLDSVRIVLLAYNEDDSISSVLTSVCDHLSSENFDYRVYVVNDGSTDMTRIIVEELSEKMPVTLLNHKTNLGVAQAFNTGLRKAVSDSSLNDVIVTMEADGTSVTDLLTQMANTISSGYDIVCASRYCDGGELPNFPWQRRLYSANANRLLRIFFPISGLSDYTLFYRAYRSSLLSNAIQYYGSDFITSTGFVSNAEILIKLRPFEPKVFEFPMVYDYSVKKSKSNMRVISNIAEYIRIMLRLKL
ncbi:MAG TPA: hypothetical protein DGM69_04715 [Chloroflexi bacterium]|nr:hypothetical protein [Chloroflexota bacterium]|tara:strand:+ start:167 stop:904 length:738 start_codon:yes stop_codon:yes gene_type:complete